MAVVTGRASENEMVICFLRAELDSPTEASHLIATLEDLGVGTEIISVADIENDADSRVRRGVFMAYRGREPLFRDLPWADVTWQWATVSEEELRNRTYTCRHHFEAAYGTRLIGEIANQWNGTDPSIPSGVVDRVRRGEVLEPPILVAEPSVDRMVILEGHNRLISYLRNSSDVAFPIRALIGVTPRISEWREW